MSCPFCEFDERQVLFREERVVCLWDRYPVSKGHALVIPERHVSLWTEVSDEERGDLLSGVERAQGLIDELYGPDGFNVGVNVGEAGGQTVPHVHVHVIPRYLGDTEDPRGGVRHVIPGKGNLANERLLRRDSSASDESAVEEAQLVYGNASQPLVDARARDLGRARTFELAVAFVTAAGLDVLEPYVREFLDRTDSRLSLLTGDYLQVTEPRALRRLLDWREEYGQRVALRVFQTSPSVGFHPKAYLLRREDRGAVAFIGSSNLTRHALQSGIEWNQRIIGSLDDPLLAAIAREMEQQFRHPATRDLDADWIEAYEERFQAGPEMRPVGVHPSEEEPSAVPVPHGLQVEALEALNDTRQRGNRAGLVVMATGLGKTWLAAFDSEQFRRVLFVAHREEILRQSLATFRRIRPDSTLGMYTGTQKEAGVQVLFASIQTLGRRDHLRRFRPDQFDYIVVDEFHHAAARTYRRLIDYFEPKFLLGLTATPERTDGGDLLALCGENLVYRCDLVEGVRRDLLAPFHYFGVADEVDFENIPWRNGRFDPRALENAVATERRAQLAWEHWQARRQERTLGFCVSRRHANFMRHYFEERGARVAVVHSGPDSDSRTEALERLADGELDIVFSVDMFNEGVDLPAVDTILMLRPTESKILWLQQFGRGLRITEGKKRLHVIDFIGNHRTFLQAAMLLLPGAGQTLGEIRMALEALERAALELPPGCFIDYDLEALNLLKALAAPPEAANQVETWYRTFRELHGRRPSASEAFHEGYPPGSVRRSFGSWLAFVKAQGDFDEAEQSLFDAQRPFLEALEVTPMIKSYKMLTLLAMVAQEQFPGAIAMEDLTRAVRRQARRVALLQEELGDALEDPASLRRLLEEDPIRAWCDEKALKGQVAFSYEDGHFRSLIETEPGDGAILRDWVQEIADWRLSQYLEHLHGELHFLRQFVCSVSHTGGRPILFLPDRKKNPGIPEGWHSVIIGDKEFEANFVKIAINQMREPGGADNVLPDILRRMFGASAGEPGRRERVSFQWEDASYSMKALAPEGSRPTLWQTYMRKDIPGFWGLEFSTSRWNQGFVVMEEHIFLLVTLAKGDMQEAHQYEDRFVSESIFHWLSQNRTKRSSPAGEKIQSHLRLGIDVHLFVRDRKKTPKGKAAPFVYCGEVDFLDWEGDQPIEVTWRLREPLPSALWQS